MRDPHVHVEKTPVPGFGNATMRDLITAATGLACDLPKTAGTAAGGAARSPRPRSYPST